MRIEQPENFNEQEADLVRREPFGKCVIEAQQ